MDIDFTGLRQSLGLLQQQAAQIAAQLNSTAHTMAESGAVPSETQIDALDDHLRAYRIDFDHLRDILRNLAATIPLTSYNGPDDLADLNSLLEVCDAIEAECCREKLLERDRAFAILQRIQKLVHLDRPNFAPLLVCQAQAKELADAIGAVEPPAAQDVAHQLATGEHPLASLLALIDGRDSLEDDVLEQLQEVVVRAGGTDGRKLSIAALRGKIGDGYASRGAVTVERKTTGLADASVYSTYPNKRVPTVIPEPLLHVDADTNVSTMDHAQAGISLMDDSISEGEEEGDELATKLTVIRGTFRREVYAAAYEEVYESACVDAVMYIGDNFSIFHPTTELSMLSARIKGHIAEAFDDMGYTEYGISEWYRASVRNSLCTEAGTAIEYQRDEEREDGVDEDLYDDEDIDREVKRGIAFVAHVIDDVAAKVTAKIREDIEVAKRDHLALELTNYKLIRKLT